MATNTLKTRIKHSYKTESEWTSLNPVLLEGEIAYSSDNGNKHKVGNGTSTWSQLSYVLPTKADIGLGNVENKSSATIRGELTKANVTTALGYTPPTTNTTYGVATSSALGLVKSGTDITVDSSGNVSVNDDSHNHVISNVDGLQSALDGKAPSSHTHTKSQISDFPSSLPASDVYSWAKASTKPSYAWSEITNKPSSFSPSSHSHNVLSVQSENYKQGTDLPSTYPQGETIFFSNNPTNRFNNVQYCTIHTIKGYSNIACIQFLYPYNTNADTIYYRTAIYNSDSWRSWQTISVNGHTHNYAGSSSAGGSANSAVKLDSSAGSATQPVYFSGGKPTACTYTLGKSVPSNAVFTDTNTWRGIQNNLTSDSTTDSLSAAQGKVLKGLVDGKAASSHGNHVPATETANNAKFLRNDNTWQTVTPANIGAAASSHTHSSYVNQNAFSNVTVGSTTVSADSATDTLTLVAGSNVTITPDATNDKITIAAKDTNTHYDSGTIVNNSTSATSNTTSALTNGNVYLNHIENGSVKNSHKISGSGATTVTSDASGNIVISSTDNNTTYSTATASTAGLMSASDKSKLDGIASGANAYKLPTASSSTLGGVKTKSSVTSTSGLTACPIISGVPYYKDTNTTYTLSSITGTLAVSKGGTGSTTATGARSNLGAIGIVKAETEPTSQNVGDMWFKLI